MKLKPYLKPLCIFASLYFFGFMLLGLLALKLNIHHSSFRIAILFVAAYLAVLNFMKNEEKTPELKDTVILSIGSLIFFWVTLIGLHIFFSIPFFISIFIIQSATVLFLVFIIYGFFAKKYLYKKLVMNTLVNEKDENKTKAKTWAEIYSPQAEKSEIDAESYIQEHDIFPVPDRSNIKRNNSLSRGPLDLGWSKGTINIGDFARPFFAETWAEQGHVTMQTFFFSRIGLENMTASMLLKEFKKESIIECASNVPVELFRLEDRLGHPIWSFNLCIGSGSTVYVSQSPSYMTYPQPKRAYTRCVVCGADNIEPIATFAGRGVPHGRDHHKTVYDYRELSRCKDCHNGQLEVYSHDCWSHEEAWDMYWWYAIKPQDITALMNMIKQPCNVPLYSECACFWHQELERLFKSKNIFPPYVTAAEKAEVYLWLSLTNEKRECCDAEAIMVDVKPDMQKISRNDQ